MTSAQPWWIEPRAELQRLGQEVVINTRIFIASSLPRIYHHPGKVYSSSSARLLMSSHDFAAAQRRIAARRQARDAETQALLQARQSKSQIEAQLSKLPAPLGTVGRAGVSVWESINGRKGTNPSFRVGQVDAELLDEELLGLLKGQVGDASKYFGSHLQDEWGEEIMLGLRAVLFKLTIWDHGKH